MLLLLVLLLLRHSSLPSALPALRHKPSPHNTRDRHGTTLDNDNSSTSTSAVNRSRRRRLQVAFKHHGIETPYKHRRREHKARRLARCVAIAGPQRMLHSCQCNPSVNNSVLLCLTVCSEALKRPRSHARHRVSVDGVVVRRREGVGFSFSFSRCHRCLSPLQKQKCNTYLRVDVTSTDPWKSCLSKSHYVFMLSFPHLLRDIVPWLARRQLGGRSGGNGTHHRSSVTFAPLEMSCSPKCHLDKASLSPKTDDDKRTRREEQGVT